MFINLEVSAEEDSHPIKKDVEKVFSWYESTTKFLSKTLINSILNATLSCNEFVVKLLDTLLLLFILMAFIFLQSLYPIVGIDTEIKSK